MAVVRHKEAIHSGHFMISDFEAEAQDEEDLTVPPPEEGSNIPHLIAREEEIDVSCGPQIKNLTEPHLPPQVKERKALIDVSLNNLFQNMSIAYRQKLTSPKWNRFRGLKLRWKDKIRLNNVIWRVWHMQFVKGRDRLLCAFANPIEIDNHNLQEGGTVLEGKYWKRKLQTITKEYMRWRLFYKRKGHVDEDEGFTDEQWDCLFQTPFQMLEGSKDDVCLEALAPEDDFFVDALFNSLQFDGGVKGATSNNMPVPFSNPRDMTKYTHNSDFIQPAIGQLAPNLDDFLLDLDTDWLTPNRNGNQQQNNFHSQNQISNDAKPRPLGILQQQNQMVFDIQPQQQQQQQQPPNVQAPYGAVSQPQMNGQNGSNISSSQNNNYSRLGTYPAQKRLMGPITCTSEKRHSPKHRILHHREYPLEISSPVAQSSSSITTSSITPSSTTTANFSNSFDRAKTNSKPISFATRNPSSSFLETREAVRPPFKRLPQTVTSAQTMQKPTMLAYTNTGQQNHKLIEQQQPLPLVTASSKLYSPVDSKPASTNSFTPNANNTRDANSQLKELLKANAKINSDDKIGGRNDGGSRGGGSNTYALRYLSLIPPPPPSSAPQPRICSPISPSQRRLESDRSRGPDLQDNRRNVHVSSEQKRRGTLKNGFDLMRSLIPALHQNASLKISKAALLHKGGDYLLQLKNERSQLADAIESHKREAERLNEEITRLQSLMASDGTISSFSNDAMQLMDTMFDSHVERCTMQNWKYYIFACIMRPLLSSFHSTVTTNSMEEMSRSTVNWMDQQMSLVNMRRMAMLSLKELCTSTDILSEPQRLPEEAVKSAADQKFKKSSTKNKSIKSEF